MAPVGLVMSGKKLNKFKRGPRVDERNLQIGQVVFKEIYLFCAKFREEKSRGVDVEATVPHSLDSQYGQRTNRVLSNLDKFDSVLGLKLGHILFGATEQLVRHAGERCDSARS